MNLVGPIAEMSHRYSTEFAVHHHVVLRIMVIGQRIIQRLETGLQLMVTGAYNEVVAVKRPHRRKLLRNIFKQRRVACEAETAVCCNEYATLCQPRTGQLDFLLRQLVERSGHLRIKPCHAVSKALKDTIQRFCTRILVQIVLREHFLKPVPGPVPLAVILILIEQEGFLKPVQRRRDHLDQISGFFLDLLNIQRPHAFNQRHDGHLYIIHEANDGFAVQRGKQRQILRHNPSEVAAGESPLDKLPARLTLPVVFDIIEIRPKCQLRRLPESMPVHVHARLQITIQRVILSFISR